MNIKYTPEENATWRALIVKRRKSLAQQACAMYLEGLEKLRLPLSYVPTPLEVNNLIQTFTKWSVVPTSELVGATKYFEMLSKCEFPVITDIRPSDQIDFYSSPKPDVIHEYFGHGPFLTNVEFTNFMEGFAQIARKYEPHEQLLLGRLFWYTIEFGLINTQEGLRAYGAAIIPSETETRNAIYSDSVERREFNILDILRTPFSALENQVVYYVIPSFDTLYSLMDEDIAGYVAQACKLGSFS